MSVSIGIVGLPNVGKSTLFNALLKKQIALAANYPFATIEPNTGIAQVPDPRLPVLAEIVQTTVIKPATVEFTDIAGLVRGASKGEGLGNTFLAHIRETDVISHVLRAFSDKNVIREGAVTPEEDLATIRMELQLADLATLEKQKPPKGGGDKDLQLRWEYAQKFQKTLSDGQMVFAHFSTYGDEKVAQKYAKELNLLTAKPEIFVINVDEEVLQQEIQNRKVWAEKLKTTEDQIVLVSAKIESEIAVLSQEDQQLYLAELGLEESGLERLAQVAYKTLRLQSFLTAGEKEVKAWTIRAGMTAPQAAGVIHTDFEKHFITAKVASYDDFVQYKGWSGLKEVGKVRQEGRDYVMQEGDVVEFMIGK